MADPTSLPVLPPLAGRPLYFEVLTDEERAALIAKGYAPRSIFELPRSTPQDEVNYLLAVAQGMEEGTIPASRERIELVELEMKANRMLGQKHTVTRVNVDVGRREAQKLLEEWRPSRHTLAGNTTIVRPDAVAPITGVRRRGKVSKAGQK